MFPAKLGSPPQVRGKRKVKVYTTAEDRITPAGAGKTFGSSTQYVVSWDHPRRCGENTFQTLISDKGIGSPPQVRGKPWSAPPSPCNRRITPAGAGKTMRLHSRRHSAKDHPRRCGENSYLFHSACYHPGSPPQVRGKRLCRGMRYLPSGITPAGAGKTIGVLCGVALP